MRRFILGLILLGILAIVGGKCAPYYIAMPSSFSLADAKAEVDGKESRIVTIAAAPEEGVRWYGAKYYNASDKTVPLSKYSMTAGIPLVGPGAPPVGEWNELVGHEVVAEAPLGSRRIMLSSSQRSVDVGDSRINGVIERKILSSVGGLENVWVLSRSQTTLGGLSDVQPEYTKAESEWAGSGKFRGVLRRFSDFDFSGNSLDSIKGYYRKLYGDPSMLDDAWLIAADYNGGGEMKEGYYFYAPVAGSDGKIWAQFPANEVSEKAWKEKRPTELTGVWLPAGAHSFDPAQVGSPAGKVALLRTADYDREEFVDRRWKDRYGRAAFLIGIAVTIVSSLLFLGYSVATSGSPLAAAKGE